MALADRIEQLFVGECMGDVQAALAVACGEFVAILFKDMNEKQIGAMATATSMSVAQIFHSAMEARKAYDQIRALRMSGPDGVGHA